MMWSRWSLPLFVTLLVVFLAGQAVRPLTDSTEARYSEIAREMLASGNWLIPTLDQVPHLSKPPLTTWLMAGSMALLGTNEIAARLPGLLAFLGTIALVARLAALLGRPQLAAWAAFLFGLSMAPLLGAVYPSTDTLLAFFETAAATAYVMHQMGYPRARWWFFLSLGAAFLTKGPPALLVPAAVIIGDRLLRAKNTFPRSTRPLLLWVPGWLCFALLGLGWYIAVALTRPDTMNYWLHDEVVNRIFTSRHGRNQSPLIYLVTLVAGTFPWWLLYFKMFKNSPRFVEPWREGARPILVSWFLLPLLVFVFSKSRLPAYLLPLFPALTLLLALEAPRWWRQVPARWFGIRPGYMVAYALFLAVLSLASIPLSQRSSWKVEGRKLETQLSRQDYEMLLLSPGEAGSFEFYLAPKRIRILSLGQTADASHDLTTGTHLIFAHEAHSPMRGTCGPPANEPGPIFLKFKNHCALWMNPGPTRTAS